MVLQIDILLDKCDEVTLILDNSECHIQSDRYTGSSPAFPDKKALYMPDETLNLIRT